MLGIGCPDRHALPHITRAKHTDPDSCSLPRERVRSSTHLRHSAERCSVFTLAVRRTLGGSFGRAVSVGYSSLFGDITLVTLSYPRIPKVTI